MAIDNKFNVLKFKDTDRLTVEIVEQSASKARYAFDTFGTDRAFFQVRIDNFVANQVIIKPSGVLSSASENDKNKPVHFVTIDPETKEPEEIEIIYDSVTSNGGDLHPVEYAKAVKRVIIDVEVTGANQEVNIFIGAAFDSVV